MNKVLYAHMCMVVAVILVCAVVQDGTVRLYYYGKPSRLSHSSKLSMVWVSTRRNATHYVDVPSTLLIGMYEGQGMDYSTGIGSSPLSYYIYRLHGSVGKHVRRTCREVA